jgi:hypothetical protein
VLQTKTGEKLFLLRFSNAIARLPNPSGVRFALLPRQSAAFTPQRSLHRQRERRAGPALRLRRQPSKKSTI